MPRRIDPDTGEILDDDDDAGDYSAGKYAEAEDFTHYAPEIDSVGTAGDWDRYDLPGDMANLEDFLDGLEPGSDVYVNAEGDLDTDYGAEGGPGAAPDYGWLNILPTTKAEDAAGSMHAGRFQNIDRITVFVIPPSRIPGY